MKNIISQIINVITVLAMTYFAIPKLLGKAMSVKGFEQFEHAIQLNATFFRIFTGLSELLMAIIVLVFIFTKNFKIGFFAYSFLFVTMISALSLEFFARPEPKMMLVKIAVVLVSFSIYQLSILKNKIL